VVASKTGRGSLTGQTWTVQAAAASDVTSATMLMEGRLVGVVVVASSARGRRGGGGRGGGQEGET
jgi:hypothetical protein